MNFDQGFENPRLAQTTLQNILEHAARRGFEEPARKVLAEKISRTFAQGVADPEAALISLERLFSEGDSELIWLLAGERLEKVLKFFGYSEFLGRHALKYPEQLKSALEKIERGKAVREKIFQELEEKISGAQSFEELSRGLRVFKNERYLVLGLENLFALDRLEDEMAEVSWIAEACLELGLQQLLKLRSGKKRVGENGCEAKTPLCVLGMGKLGSGELNFSSDIDLVYLCPESGSAAGDDNRFREYTSLAEQLTRLLSEITELGFIFRIDLRLRPGGENGPLVNPLDAAVDYYQNFGRNWERAALLRCRPLAGELALGRKFLQEIESFVFRRSHDFASFEDLKELKTRIDQEARRQAGQDGFSGYDVKLGPGGIREIEFFVQALQLIYGGRHPELRIPHTMQALNKLQEKGLVNAKDAQALAEAWHLLRRIEHRIQLKNLRQDHCIPKSRRGQEILARSFGFCGKDATEKLKSEMARATTAVASIFSGLFGEELKQPSNRFVKLLDFEAEPEEMETEFAQLHFEEPDLAAESWSRILNPLRRAQRAPRLLAEVLPVLLQEIAASPEPDLALLQLEKFLSRTGAGAGYLSLLKDHPAVRKMLVDFFSTSEFLGNLLIGHPELLDELVSPAALKPRTASELESELESFLAAAADYEEKLARLRRFQKMELLRIGMEELSGRLEQKSLEERLTILAEIILEQAYKVSWDELVSRHGKPGRESQGQLPGLLILGLGRLGSREMSWASDLDLIFIYQGHGSTSGEQPLEVHEFFIRLCQKIISTLQTQTSHGFLYKIDTRLRPSGTQGPLVVSVDGFDDYHRSESQVWEKQALIKARPLVDGAGIRGKVMSQVERGIYAKTDPSHLKQEMRKLLARVKDELARENENLYDIKFGYGGEMELEYIIQYLQLLHGESRPEIRAGNSWLALDKLYELEIISRSDYLSLREALALYRRLSSRMRIYRDRPEHRVRLQPKLLDRLAKKSGIDGLDSGEKLLKKLSGSRELVHRLLSKYIGE